ALWLDDFALIFVPYGHCDETKILPCAKPLFCLKGADGGQAAVPSVDADIFDVALLNDSFGAFYRSAAEFVEKFLTSLEARIPTLQEAVSGEDGPRARDIAHALKGAANSIGATRIGGVFGDIQDMLDADDIATAAMFFDVLPDMYAELRDEFGPLCDHFLR
ncbi:MAG: Hpt domain-containing protein, partial [Alphaproteobacteria bacterium]|nr:Hpt domain-containing protein [Alphaproteobacteria bacterium]